MTPFSFLRGATFAWGSLKCMLLIYPIYFISSISIFAGVGNKLTYYITYTTAITQYYSID
jgi:hypothetical protein